jgi:hypothetical protein
MPGSMAGGGWLAPHNDTFARPGRCLLFVQYSRSPRDCGACRTIAWCKYYDHAGMREFEEREMVRWATECRRRAALALRVSRATEYTCSNPGP